MNKTEINHIVFFSGFKVKPTIKEDNKTIYTLYDDKADIDIQLHLSYIIDTWSMNIICDNLDKLSKTGAKRYQRVLDKLNKFDDLVVNVNPEDFTEEELKKIDEECVKEGIDIETIENSEEENVNE